MVCSTAEDGENIRKDLLVYIVNNSCKTASWLGILSRLTILLELEILWFIVIEIHNHALHLQTNLLSYLEAACGNYGCRLCRQVHTQDCLQSRA